MTTRHAARVPGRSKRAIVAAAGSLALVASALVMSPAEAAGVEDFNAPLLGTTATAQVTRFPSAAEITCSDAACTDGIFAQVEQRGVEYSTTRIMPDAGYTRVPQFRRGVASTWFDATRATTDVAYVTFVIAEYASGSDMVSVAKAIAAGTETSLAPIQVGGREVWVGETLNKSESDNVYAGTGFKSAYVLGENSFVRAGCQLGESVLATTTCTIPGLAKLAVRIADRAPQPVVGRAQLGRILPASYPKGMRPLVLSSVNSAVGWGTATHDAALLAAVDKQPTALTQFTLSGAPRMAVDAVFSGLAKSSLARAFVAERCVSTATRACRTTKLPGGLGYQNFYFDAGTKRGNARIIFVGAGNGRLVSVDCNKRVIAGAMTVAEQAKCTKAATALLASTVAS